jgi:AcrR family transcriptional regulator
MEKKQKKKNLSRDHILKSALKVIGAEGMGGLTHRSVAKKANVAHSTVSYYFRTIDDIASNAFKKIRHENRNFMDEQNASLANTGKKRTPRKLMEFAAEISKNEYDSGYILQAEQELLLYTTKNEQLRAENKDYVTKGCAAFDNFLKECGYKNPNGLLIHSFWSGYEKSALEMPEIYDFSDIADQAMQIIKTFK